MEFQLALSPRTSFFSCSRTQCTEDGDNESINDVGGDDDDDGGDDDGGDDDDGDDDDNVHSVLGLVTVLKSPT